MEHPGTIIMVAMEEGSGGIAEGATVILTNGDIIAENAVAVTKGVMDEVVTMVMVVVVMVMARVEVMVCRNVRHVAVYVLFAHYVVVAVHFDLISMP